MKIKTTEANRFIKIYMQAVARSNLNDLDPPATEKELTDFKIMCKKMRAEEAKAKEEGRTLIWDIPFDPET